MPMSLWKRKGGKKRWGGVTEIRSALLNAQTPEKWSFLCTSSKNRSICFATVHCKALGSERQGLKSQPPSSPEWAFWYHTGWFSPGWCQNLPKIRMQLWGGNAAKSTYRLCLRDVTRLLQELLTDAPTKSKIPLCQAVSRCPSQKQKDRKHMLSPSV